MFKISENDVAPLKLNLSDEQKTALLDYLFSIGSFAERIRDNLTREWTLYQDVEDKQEAICCDQVDSLICELEEAIRGYPESFSPSLGAPESQLQESSSISS